MVHDIKGEHNNLGESKILTGLFDDSVSDKVSLISHQDDWLAEEEAPGAELREDQLGLAQGPPAAPKCLRAAPAVPFTRGDENALTLTEDRPRH